MKSTRVFNGIPSLSLFSAKSRKWEQVSGPHAIDIPLSKDDIFVAKDDVDSDISTHISFSGVIKILLAEGKYPDLGENDIFAVSDILINRDKSEVTVVGNVIREV